MQSAFIHTFSIVTPLVIWMGAGYYICHVLQLDLSWRNKANSLIFRLLLPAMFFRSAYTSNIRQEMSTQSIALVLFILTGVIVSYIAMNIVCPRFIKAPEKCGVFIQGSLRANNAMYAIPLASSLYGEDKVAIVSITVTLVVIAYNIVNVITLERFHTGGKGNHRLNLLKSIVRNPLLVATAAGLLLGLLGLDLPAPVNQALEGLTACATPLAFVLLGAGFSFRMVRNNKKLLVALIAIKLVLYPLLWVVIAILVGYRGLPLATVMLLFAPATAISAHPMAISMGGDEELSSCLTPLTSVLAIITLFLWIFALTAIGLI